VHGAKVRQGLDPMPVAANNGAVTFKQGSPADARVTSAVIPRWPSAAILDFIEPQIAPFDPPNPKTLI